MIYFLNGESSLAKSLPSSTLSKCLLETSYLEYNQQKETGNYHQYEHAIRPYRHWLQKQQQHSLLGLLADDGKVVMYGCISGHHHHHRRPHYLHRHHLKQQPHHHRYYHYPHHIRQPNRDCIDAKCHQHQRYPSTKTINTTAAANQQPQQYKQRKSILNHCSSSIEHRTVMLIGSFTLDS